MMRPRGSEIADVTALLEAEHEDVESLANDVLKAAVNVLLARELWVAVAVYPSEIWVHGPFFSRREAEKVVLSGVLEARGDARLLIRRLINGLAGVSADA
jgi:hypothetical protein